MSTPEQIASASAAIATALQTLPPEDREKAINIAVMMCPVESPKPRAPRRDKGKTRGDKSMGVPE